VDVDRGLIFAERDGYRALELDVYRPDGAGLRPLVVFVHGGGWRVSHRSRPPRETRAWTRGFFERITDAGFVVATPEYRFSAEAIFPAQLDDTLDAVRWLHANAADLGVDPAHTYLWGQSGGGLLAGLVGLVAEAPPVRGVVCWYSYSDFLALDRATTDSFEAHLLGGPIGERLDLARAASPVTHVRPGAPPFLLQHGESDTWVPVGQSVALADALRAAGGRVELEIVPGADHFFGGSPDVEAIFGRAVDFLSGLDARSDR
jgi:acetyl esterase/lipase